MQNRKREFKELGIVSAFILFAITIIVTALLAGVDQFTEPVISQHQVEEAEISHEHVFEDAVTFTDRSAELLKDHDDKRVVTVFDALDEDGKVIGVVLETLAAGYGGDVKVMTGISPELEIVGLEVVSNTETPGLGTKITEESFMGRFIGKTPGVKFSLKTEDSDMTHIDALTGATLSSRAVVNAVNSALDFASDNMDTILAGGDSQ